MAPLTSSLATVTARGFVVGTDLLGGKDIEGERPFQTKGGGRVDIAKEVNDVKLVASITDATARDVVRDGGPNFKDLLFTAEKRVNENAVGMVGFDVGARSVFAKIGAETDLAGKEVHASAMWFQEGNHVRTEASAKLDEGVTLWGTHTFNNEGNALSNSTWVNLKEREGFVISPFTVPISTSAAKLSVEREGYLVEPAVDFNKRAAYLSVAKNHDRYNYRASYAFKEETAMLEVGVRRNILDSAPMVRGYLKSPVSPNSVGPLSIGVIVDHTFEL